MVLIIWNMKMCFQKFGFFTSYGFLLFLAFADCSNEHALSIRMYALSIMLVTLCFYFGYELLNKSEKKYWIAFTISGIGAAYTHYFALVSVGMIYICIFAILIYRNKSELRKCMICSVTCIVSYLPWLYYFVKSVERVNGDYWIDGFPSVQECITFLYGKGMTGDILFGIFIVSVGVIIYKNAARKIEKIDNESIMAFVALIATVGVILFGYIYASLIQPIFITRYLYPLAGAMWLAFGIAFSKMKKKTVQIAVLLFVACMLIPGSISNFRQKRIIKNENNSSIKYLKENYKANDILTADRDQLPWKIYPFYIPDVLTYNFWEIEWEKVSDENVIYMLVEGEINDEDRAVIEEHGRKAKLIKSDTYIGDYPGNLFVIEKQ